MFLNAARDCATAVVKRPPNVSHDLAKNDAVSGRGRQSSLRIEEVLFNSGVRFGFGLWAILSKREIQMGQCCRYDDSLWLLVSLWI